MSGSFRMNQINAAVKEAIGSTLLTETTDERLHRVTITQVSCSKDLHYAKVYYTALADEEEHNEIAKALAKAAGFVQSRIGNHVRMKYTPQLRFILDDAQIQADRLQQLLREADMGPDEPAPDAENEGAQDA